MNVDVSRFVKTIIRRGENHLVGVAAYLFNHDARFGLRDVLGDFQLIVIPSFGGLPYDQAIQSLELFAGEVMPGVRELQG